MNSNRKLVIFDLDYTLWPLCVSECLVPFMKDCSNDTIVDSNGRICYLYKDVFNILKFLKKKSYTLAIASRSKNICGSYQLLHLFGIADYFQYKEIYPGSKLHHFYVLFKKSNIRFENMVFFENDIRNINEVKTLGVQCFCVTEEISLKLICSTLNPKKKGKDTVIIYPK